MTTVSCLANVEVFAPKVCGRRRLRTRRRAMRHERQAFDAMGAWASRCTLIESARMFYCSNSLSDGTERRRNEEHRQPFYFCFYEPTAAIGFFYSSTDSASMPTRKPFSTTNPTLSDVIHARISPMNRRPNQLRTRQSRVITGVAAFGEPASRIPSFSMFRKAEQCVAPNYFPRRANARLRARNRCQNRRKSERIRGSNRNSRSAIRNGCQPKETRVFSDVYLSFQLFSAKTG